MTRFYREKPVQSTRFHELGYQWQGNANWRIVDRETGSAVGPFYATKAELLGDLGNYAREYGCDNA